MQVKKIDRKLPLAVGLAVLTVAAVVLIPTLAFAKESAAKHDHAAHMEAAADNATLKDELAQVRRVTARFHDLDAALDAGYELGWVNGSGIQDHHRLRRAPDGGSDGLPLLQPGADGRSRGRPARA